MLALISKPAHARSTVVENCSARPAIIPAIPARHYDSRRMLLGKESSSLLAEFQPLDKCREEIFMLSHVYWKLDMGLQIRVVTPLPERLIDWLHLAHLAKENNLPLQLSPCISPDPFRLWRQPKSLARSSPRCSTETTATPAR